jgi:putative membrane protein
MSLLKLRPSRITETTVPLRTPPAVIAAIIGVSAAASAFICWLVYFHIPVDVTGARLHFLPAVNAVLNALSALALLAGLYYITQDLIARHRAVMFSAFFFSAIFLVSYLVNFALHGETKFDRLNPWWPVYWPILASHILLSVIALPMILITFFFALTARFPAHRRIAQWTFPLWLYVSVTGVIVYLMQAVCR